MMRFCGYTSASSAAQLATLLLYGLDQLVNASDVTVTLDDGAYLGSSINGVNRFLGLRFGEQPTRFEPPVPAKKHQGVFNATAYPASCWQVVFASLPNAAIAPKYNESEDCLFLNVYAPSTPAPPEGRTVMLWYYGGGFQLGSANTADFDGMDLARNHDVIVVAPNYRTSVFGFPGAIEGIKKPNRNVGLFDQKLAADWVQRNIHSFGGDPAKVTIFGESAGAASVDFLLLTSGLNPPFRAAIMESGTSYFYTSPEAGGDLLSLITGKTTATKPFKKLATALGCPTKTKASLECVRAAPAPSLVAALQNNDLYFPPVADGEVNVPTSPDRTRALNRVPKIPILIGSNFKEGDGFTYARPVTPVTEVISQSFPGDTVLQQQIAAAYPVGDGQPFATDLDAINQFATDLDFGCAAAHEARLSATAGIPTWRYLFNSTTFPFSDQPLLMQPIHSSEVPFVFGHLPPPPATPGQALALSAFMQVVWTSFAKNPINGPDVPEWIPFTGAGASDLADLGANNVNLSMVNPSVIDSRCYLYDAVYARGLAPATPVGGTC